MPSWFNDGQLAAPTENEPANLPRGGEDALLASKSNYVVRKQTYRAPDLFQRCMRCPRSRKSFSSASSPSPPTIRTEDPGGSSHVRPGDAPSSRSTCPAGARRLTSLCAFACARTVRALGRSNRNIEHRGSSVLLARHAMLRAAYSRCPISLQVRLSTTTSHRRKKTDSSSAPPFKLLSPLQVKIFAIAQAEIASCVPSIPPAHCKTCVVKVRRIRGQ